MFKANLLILSAALFGVISARSPVLEESSPTIQELCALAPGSTILRPNTCTNWIKCPSTPEGQDLEEGACVFGLYFNKDKGVCQYKDELVCPFESTPKNRCTNAKDNTFMADPNNCNGFIYCQDGEELKSNCPSDLVFDPKNSGCVYKNQYTCPASKPVSQSNPICKSLPNNAFFADQTDCTKYSHCLDGDLSSHDCTKDQAWDYLKGICVPIADVVCLPTAKKPEPESTICGTRNNTIAGPISDGISCSGYYFCQKMADGADRHPEHFTCSAGTFFDTKTLSCRDRLNVKCPLDRCEGMGNKYVNVAGDCKAYALCHNNVAANYGNCPSEYFFDERTQGCTPQVVSYAACSA